MPVHGTVSRRELVISQFDERIITDSIIYHRSSTLFPIINKKKKSVVRKTVSNCDTRDTPLKKRFRKRFRRENTTIVVYGPRENEPVDSGDGGRSDVFLACGGGDGGGRTRIATDNKSLVERHGAVLRALWIRETDANPSRVKR